MLQENIQEAIRLHEKGSKCIQTNISRTRALIGHQDLEASTGMFGRLADPNTHNNALSQVLYGLALR